MPAQESRLFLWGGAAVIASGLFWALPVLNALSAIAAVTGIILIVARLGYGRGIMASVSGILVLMAVGLTASGAEDAALNSAIFIMAVVGPGMAMGGASRNLLSPVRAAWYGMIPPVIMMAALSFTYVGMLGNMPSTLRQINTAFVTFIDDNPAVSKMLTERYGGGADAQERFLGEVDKAFEFLIRIMPGMLVMGFLALIVVSLVAAGTIASRMQIMMPRFRSFHLWRASDWWLLPTVLGLVLVVFMKDELWRYAGGNILIVSGNIYAVVGLAVLEAFLRRLLIPPAIKVVFYALLFLLGSFLALVLLAVLGLADSRLNFKRENLDRDDKNME